MRCRSLFVLIVPFLFVTGCEHGKLFSRRDKKAPSNGKPETYVTYGDFSLRESFSPKIPKERQQQKRYEARCSYEKALEKDSNCLAAYRGLAETHYVNKDTELAIATAEKGLKKHAKDANLWMTLGKCHARQKAWPKAVAAMSNAVAIVPKNEHFARTLGYAQAYAGAIDDSFSTLAKVMSEAEAKYTIARVLYQTGQDEKARRLLIHTLEMKPTFTDAHQLLQQINYGVNQGREIQQVGHDESQELIPDEGR